MFTEHSPDATATLARRKQHGLSWDYLAEIHFGGNTPPSTDALNQMIDGKVNNFEANMVAVRLVLDASLAPEEAKDIVRQCAYLLGYRLPHDVATWRSST